MFLCLPEIISMERVRPFRVCEKVLNDQFHALKIDMGVIHNSTADAFTGVIPTKCKIKKHRRSLYPYLKG